MTVHNSAIKCIKKMTSKSLNSRINQSRKSTPSHSRGSSRSRSQSPTTNLENMQEAKREETTEKLNNEEQTTVVVLREEAGNTKINTEMQINNF